MISLMEFVERLTAKVKRHERHYSTDIFPDYTLKETPDPSIDQISAKMGRHMCKCFFEYINEAIAESLIEAPNEHK